MTLDDIEIDGIILPQPFYFDAKYNQTFVTIFRKW